MNGYKDWQKTPFTNGNHSFVPDSCCKEVKPGCGDISSGTDHINIDVSTMSYFQPRLGTVIFFVHGVSSFMIVVNQLFCSIMICSDEWLALKA